jgi:predicted negative regulator of RcsB-dependent stress response
MKTKLTYTVIVTMFFLFGALASWSQTSQVSGKITSGNQPVPDAQVILTSQSTGKTYKFKTDKNGQFTGIGIAYGRYDEVIQSPTGTQLFKGSVFVSGTGDVQDLSADVSPGKPGVSGPSKEEVEKLKAERDKAVGENTLIAQLNPALKEKNWAAAEPLLIKLVGINPNRMDYQQALANAQLNLGKYDEAVATSEKAIPLADSAAKDPKGEAKPDPAKSKAATAQLLTIEGDAYLKLKKNDKAIEAYSKAAEMDPNPANAYFKLCATQYNSGNTQGALPVCDKAIAADPNKADAYFIKGSLLMGDSKQDKDGKLQAPPGTAEALNKYLELAPDGPHANDVKQMLTYIGAKIETTYKEKKKK